MLKRKNGFTLIEIALTLVIVGILLGLSFTLINGLSKVNRSKKTKNNMEIIKEALIGYLLSYRRFPYADTSSPLDGKEDIDQYVGKLPFLTIGVSKADAFDAYGRVFDYDISGSATINGKLTDTTSQNICHQLQAFINGTSTATTRITLDGSNFIPVAFVLLAPGNNKQYEGENNDADRDYETKNISSDDLLMWISFSEIYARLDCGSEFYTVLNNGASSIYVKGGKYIGCTEIAVGDQCYIQKETIAYATNNDCLLDLNPIFDFDACEKIDFSETTPQGNRNTKLRWNGISLLDN